MAVLKINSEVVELGRAQIVMNKSAYPFYDFVGKTLAYSERLRLPRTNALDRIFKRPQRPDLQTDKFNIYYDYEYSEGGKIISVGKATLFEVSENGEYEIGLTDSAIEAFNRANEKIKTLSLDDYDFVFNIAAYNTLKVETSSVWLWAAANMHTLKELSKNIMSGEIAFSRPFFNGKIILDLMFSRSGWSYSKSENAAEFDNFLISTNHKEFFFTSYEKTFDTILVVPQTLNLDAPDFIKTDTVTTSTTLNLNYASFIRLRGYIDASADVVLQIAGVATTGTDTQTEIFNIQKGRFFYDLTSAIFRTAGTPYKLVFSLVGSGSVTFENTKLYTLIEEQDFGALSAKNFTDFKVKTYDNAPDFSQIEVFKHALTSIGGFFTSDNFRKCVDINSLNELSNNYALDWSLKIDENSIKAVKITNFAQLNYYKYKDDSEKTPNIGRGQFSISDATAKDTKDVYTSIYAGSQEVTINGSSLIDLPVYGDTERAAEFDAVIARAKDGGGFELATFESLDGNYILNTYYADFIAAVGKGQLIQSEFKLNKTDFFSCKFRQLVYIKPLRSTFYIINIESFRTDSLTKVTLLKK